MQYYYLVAGAVLLVLGMHIATNTMRKVAGARTRAGFSNMTKNRFLGAFVGQTITANIAVMGCSVEARSAARVHFLFNLLGALWGLAALRLLLPLVDYLVPGDCNNPEAVPDHMAAFIVVFYCINAVLFLPFREQLAKLARMLVPFKNRGLN
ncbi:MAG: hypothetical protein GY754_18395 [bacterium]|nr:hypothetical protein [bacterium]